MKIHNDLFTLLQYDTFFNVLTLHERIIIHMIHVGKFTRDNLTDNQLDWLLALHEHKWEAPEVKYDADKVLIFWDGENWQPLKNLKIKQTTNL